MTHPRTIVLVMAAATATYLTAFSLTVQGQSGATEAPAAFDNLTNGFSTQAQFDLDRASFEERDDIARGLGPVYNAQSCAECHQNPVTGATLVKGSVITWASRTRMRRWSSLAVAAGARMVPLPTVMRLAVHPGDVTSPALLSSISATLKSLLRTHAPARYADL